MLVLCIVVYRSRLVAAAAVNVAGAWLVNAGAFCLGPQRTHLLGLVALRLQQL